MKRSPSSPYRVGVIGFAHMHVNELVDRFVQCGRARIVGCADAEPRTPSRTRVEGSRHANLMRALASPGAPRAYQDYREMLDKEELDIVIMCPENARHGEVAEAAASHGAHILTEKPIAARLDEARRMAAAAREADVALAVNWPITWQPHIRRLKELIDDGAIGEVLELKWRNPASLGPLAHGSLHPGSTTIGLVSDDEKADEWWHQAAAAARAARLLLLRRLPCGLARSRAAALGPMPDGQLAQPLRRRRGQCGDARPLSLGDGDPRRVVDDRP